jgi:hypothetical protein
MSLQGVPVSDPCMKQRYFSSTHDGSSHCAERTTAYTVVVGSLAISGTTCTLRYAEIQYKYEV